MIITVNIPDEMVAQSETVASALSIEYGVTVSRSEIVRRALQDYLDKHLSRSQKRPLVTKTADEVVTI